MSEEKVTASGRKPESERVSGAPAPIDPKTGQHKDHWVLSKEERVKGFIRPVRRSYVHSKCGTATSMGMAIAETYARKPSFYSSTFCCGCRDYFLVGETGEFVWGDGTRVGT